MLGKASEISSELVDARELNEWLKGNPDVNVIQIQHASAGTSVTGIVPTALIIYKPA